MSFPPDKYRDEDGGWCYSCLEESCPGCGPDFGVNDDASEWSPEAYLNDLGDEPITLEGLIEWLSAHDDGIFHNLKVPVTELVERMKAARK